MSGRGLGSWITFNGEIYNFARIRPRLEAAGHAFDSRTDTEVILRGYATWGPSILQELRGMFALGIWNPDARELFLARDRFGIKPLYVARGDGWFLFASEVRALLATGLVEPTLDLDGALAVPGLPDHAGAAHADRGHRDARARVVADRRTRAVMSSRNDVLGSGGERRAAG